MKLTVAPDKKRERRNRSTETQGKGIHVMPETEDGGMHLQAKRHHCRLASTRAVDRLSTHR
jgi:hypothetical protein